MLECSEVGRQDAVLGHHPAYQDAVASLILQDILEIRPEEGIHLDLPDDVLSRFGLKESVDEADPLRIDLLTGMVQALGCTPPATRSF